MQIPRHFKVKVFSLCPNWTRPDPPFPVNVLTRPDPLVGSRVVQLCSLAVDGWAVTFDSATISLGGGESTLDLCYASRLVQRKFRSRSTGNHRNLQCGNDSILWANVTWDLGSSCLGAMGASVWGSALLVVGFSVLVSILLRSLSMSGAALSTRLMRELHLRGSCS